MYMLFVLFWAADYVQRLSLFLPVIYLTQCHWEFSQANSMEDNVS